MKVILDKAALRSQPRLKKPAKQLCVSQDPNVAAHLEIDGRGECRQLFRLLGVEGNYVIAVPLKMTPILRYQVLQVLCALSPHFDDIRHGLGEDFALDLAALIGRRPSGTAASAGFFL